MSDGILGVFGSILSATENLRKRKEALRDAFGQKMFGEEQWSAYQKFKKSRKKSQGGQQSPQSPGGNYPQGTLGG